MNKHKNWFRVLLAVLCTLVQPIFLLMNGDGSAGDALYFQFGSVLFAQHSSFFALLIYFLPNVFLCFFLAGTLQYDFDFMGVYLFTRTRRRGAFFAKRMAELFGFAAVYYVLYVGASLGLTAAVRGAWGGTMEFLFPALALLYLSACAVLLLLNLLSILIRPVYAFLIVVGMQLLSSSLTLLATGLVQKVLFWIFPFVHSGYAIHADAVAPSEVTLFVQPVAGFTLSYSFVYLGVLLILEFLGGLLLVHKIDFIGRDNRD